MSEEYTYKGAGVDIEEAAALVGDIGELRRRTEAKRSLMQSFGYTAVATVHGATLIMIVSDRSRGFFRRFFENGFLQMLGKYSYSVYLWHLAVAIFVGELWFDHVGRVEWNTSYLVAYCFVVSVLTLALSRVTWLLIEEPALRLKRFAPYFRDRRS